MLALWVLSLLSSFAQSHLATIKKMSIQEIKLRVKCVKLWWTVSYNSLFLVQSRKLWNLSRLYDLSTIQFMGFSLAFYSVTSFQVSCSMPLHLWEISLMLFNMTKKITVISVTLIGKPYKRREFLSKIISMENISFGTMSSLSIS